MDSVTPGLANTGLQLVHVNKHMFSLSVTGSPEAIEQLRKHLENAQIEATISRNRVVGNASKGSHAR